MGSPAIFKGSRTGLLTSKGLHLKDGSIVDNDGIPNFIKNGHAEVNADGWSTYSDIKTGDADVSNLIFINTTGVSVGDAVYFPTVGTSGLSSTSIYYVISASVSNIVKVSTTPGGSEFDITGNSTITMAKVLPIDGTGGTANITWTRSTTTPLAGSGSFLFTKDAANRIGQGASYTFNIDPAYQARVINIQADYVVSSGTFVAGTSSANSDVTVYIYDVTNSVLIQPSSFKFMSNSSSISDTFQASFQTSSNGTQYRLIFHCSTISTSAYTLKFDNIQVTPTQYAFGTPVTDWVSFTPEWQTSGTAPTLGNGTVSGKYRRIGDSAQIIAKLNLGSTSNVGTGTNYLTWPSTLSIDDSKMTSSDLVNGICQIYDNGSAANARVGTPLLSYASKRVGTYLNATGTFAATTTGWGGDGDSYTYNITIPILGWSSSVQTSDQTSTRVVAAKISAASATIPNGFNYTLVEFTSKDFDTTGMATITSGSKIKINVPGYYKVSALIQWGATGPSTNLYVMSLYKNGSSLRDIDVKYGNSNTAYTTMSGSDELYLVSGDYLQIYVGQNGAGSYSLNAAGFFAVERISGPNQIAASETVSALYTGAPPTGTLTTSFNTTTFGTKVKDSHGAYSSGTYTVPISGQYQICAALAIQGTFIATAAIAVGLYVDGVQKYYRVTRIAAAGTAGYYVSLNIDGLPLTAGQLITIRGYSEGTSTSYTSEPANWFSITRTGNY